MEPPVALEPAIPELYVKEPIVALEVAIPVLYELRNQ